MQPLLLIALVVQLLILVGIKEYTHPLSLIGIVVMLLQIVLALWVVLTLNVLLQMWASSKCNDIMHISVSYTHLTLPTNREV